MKHLTAIIFTVFCLSQLGAQSGAGISFEKETHDFGTIIQNSEAKYTFRITNSGDKPLILLDVKPGCSCTVANYTKEAILPGKSGFITAEFNKTEEVGAFMKNITVTSNAKGDDSYKMIFVKGTVVSKEKTSGS
ncbi:MAG: DUF1573 domain-containing protein [Bacteroidia bacterium]